MFWLYATLGTIALILVMTAICDSIDEEERLEALYDDMCE
jgi:hypothetical protein